MTVSLNIENDAELRAYIKDLIKGQMLSIIREEITDMVKEELQKKVRGLDSHNLEVLRRDAIKIAVREILEKEYGIDSWNADFIRPFVEERLNEAIENRGKNLFDLMVEKGVAEKIKSLLSGGK